MQKLTAADPETKSPDLAAQNLAALRALFPELITEGADGVAVNFDVLKQLVGDKTVTDAEEKYGLNWHGKRRARQLALTPSTGTLRPCPKESVDWDTTQNLMIEGDNLEVLKLLQKSYAGKVKLIYIDPPYNTGKDFVYPDNFQDNIKNYLELTGQADEGGKKRSSNPEASGRFHTDWLNMMYPRLKIARDLLSTDGVLVASIDENEHARLISVLESIFGEEAFCGEIVWKNSSKNDQNYISIQHEYFVFFSKDKQANSGIWIEKKDGLEEIYAAFALFSQQYGQDWIAIHEAALKWYGQFPEANPIYDSKHYSWMDERGVYFPSDISGPNFGQYRYDVRHPITNLPCKEPASGWRYPEDTMVRRIADGLVHFGQDHTTIPNNKTYLKDTEFQSLTSIKVKDGRAASKRLKTLFGKNVFTNPKDEFLLKDIFKALSIKGEDIVLDFFAGSGTTLHSVAELNKEKSISCRTILVQFPEDIPSMLESATGSSKKTAQNAIDYLTSRGLQPNIAELAKERLRHTGNKIKEENPQFVGDLGFRVFKLDSSNIRAWDPDRDKLVQTLQDSVVHLKADRSEQDILFELLLKLGLDLCVPIESKKLAGEKDRIHEVHSVGAGALLVCLSPAISQDDVESLGLGIVEWHEAQNTAGEATVVFRDSAFADDVAKTNLSAILNQHGIETVRSL